MTNNQVTQPSVTITIPCFNEERILRRNMETLTAFCREHLDEFHWSLLIADNHSDDQTSRIAAEMARDLPEINYFYLPEKGRGNILRHTWMRSEVDIYAYMDADLSTELRHLPDLLRAVRDGAEIAVGTRLISGARVTGRTFSREIASRGYNFLLQSFFRAGIHDAQCGFKAVSRLIRDTVIPLTRDNHWFFDSEMLLLARLKQLRIAEIPVSWEDHQSRDSKVRLFKDIRYFLGQMRLFRHRLRHDEDLIRFLSDPG